MLENDIVWVKITYLDDSTLIFRATKCKEIIEDILGRPVDRDVFDGEVLGEGYIFKVDTQVLFELINIASIESSKLKPEFSREVDRFASSFI